MPNNNFIHEAGTLPTALLAAAGDYVAGFHVRGARVGRNKVNNANEIEALLNEGLDILQREKPDRVAAARGRMSANAGAFKTHPRFARYAGVNLEDADSVDKADHARNQLHKTALTSLRGSYVHIAAPIAPNLAPPNIVVPQTEFSRLRLLLNEVRCIDETGSGMGEWGSDETYLTFAAVDENGDTQNSQQFKVRNFDDNTTKVYSPAKELANFNIHEGGNTFPKIYSGTINLMEHDHGSLAEWFKKVANAVKSKVADYILSAVGAVVGAPLGPLGAAIGAAIGWALNEIIGLISGWLGDDNIGTKVVQATINSYSGKLQNNLPSMTGSFDLTGSSSRYRVFYTWQLIT